MCKQFKCIKIKSLLRQIPFILTLLLALGGFVVLVQGVLFPVENFDSFTCSAAFFAASAITYQGYRNTVTDIQSTSRFYLEKYEETSKTVLKYLKSDKPSRRVCWVTAAKITEMLIPLEQKITSLADRELLKIYQRNLAHDLYEFINTKSSMYFTGRETASSFDEALEKPEITTSSGLIPKFKPLEYVTESSIKSILDLMNILWGDEAGYQYTNVNEFNNVVRVNYPQVAEYLLELHKRQ